LTGTEGGGGTEGSSLAVISLNTAGVASSSGVELSLLPQLEALLFTGVLIFSPILGLKVGGDMCVVILCLEFEVEFLKVSSSSHFYLNNILF
jgi:hypothetical protein